MATLDYAPLAEYARIDPAGLVTIVGGSFDRVQATSTGGAQQTYVVMRVLLDVRQCLMEPDVHYQGGKGSNISTGLASRAGCSRSWSPMIGTPTRQNTS